MNNNRDSLLKEVQMYGFAAHECNLYLDCHPDNRKALLKHAEMVKKYNEAVAKYESIYGPLTANAANSQAGWDWVSGKWPWQNYGDMEAR